jgi:hypothetical protein
VIEDSVTQFEQLDQINDALDAADDLVVADNPIQFAGGDGVAAENGSTDQVANQGLLIAPLLDIDRGPEDHEEVADAAGVVRAIEDDADGLAPPEIGDGEGVLAARGVGLQQAIEAGL